MGKPHSVVEDNTIAGAGAAQGVDGFLSLRAAIRLHTSCPEAILFYPTSIYLADKHLPSVRARKRLRMALAALLLLLSPVTHLLCSC